MSDSYYCYLEGLAEEYEDIAQKCALEIMNHIRNFFRQKFSYIDEEQFAIFLEEVKEQFYSLENNKLNDNPKPSILKFIRYPTFENDRIQEKNCNAHSLK